MDNQQFLTWLHQVTTLGYDKDIFISVQMMPQVKELFSKGLTPEQALQEIQKLQPQEEE